MPEELRDDQPATTDETETSGGTAVAEMDGESEVDGKPKRLNQVIDVSDTGPCKKHVKVTIPRADIDERVNEKYSGMMSEAVVPGYRPGKAPRKLIEKRFAKEVSEQLKSELLLQSLEQIAEDKLINPIAQPDLNPYKIEIPKDGPLEYEFDVEVAPEFELPNYKGLKLKRPVREIVDADVEGAKLRLLRSYGRPEDKDGPADMDDYVVADVTIKADGNEIRKFENISARVDPQLSFQDGTVRDFAAKMKGVKAGEKRVVDIHLAENVADPNLRGRAVQGEFDVKFVKFLKLPELTHEFLHTFGVHNEAQLDERVRMDLKLQLEYQQRQVAKEQVLQQIAAAGSWDLPQDLVERQIRKTFQRKILELRQSGFSEEEIRSRANQLRQNAQATTIKSLKEHFVLQKIADAENVDVVEDDVDYEVETIAAQSGESPRKVRARLEREDLLDALMNQILERKALDLVLSSAVYEDVPWEPEKPTAALEEQMVPDEEKPDEAPADASAAQKE